MGKVRGHVVTRQELALYDPPPPTATWRPTSHINTLDLVTETLGNAGYKITEQRLAVHRDGARFFSVLDLASTVVEGLTLAIGIRNSYDQSFPYGLVGGTRTFVCSNLSFSGDLINVRRKHTLNGQARFREATSLAIANLADFSRSSVGESNPSKALFWKTETPATCSCRRSRRF